jgi:3'-5' exoribonuclease
MHLLHLIGSHHGEYQFGSPVLPKTPEAIVLHHVDNLDAKLEMMFSAYESAPLLGRNIFERQRPLPGNLVRQLERFDAATEPAASEPGGGG